MFEKNVKSAFEKISKEDKIRKEFYILTHRKHRREIYFEKGNSDALRFIKIKFNSPIKKIFYFLLKTGLLNPFLKKISLPSEVGNLVFVGGQIKIFDLKKELVFSFPMPHRPNEEFLKSKKTQKRLGQAGFAPKVLEINTKKIFSVEEMANPPSFVDPIRSFKRLLEYYGTVKKAKTSSHGYLSILRSDLKKKNIKDSFIWGVLNRLEGDDIDLYLIDSHGDFAPGQILYKNGSIVFTDWELTKNLITEDISNFFREETDLLSNKSILEILKLYPSEVQKNAPHYFVLCELAHLAWKPFYLSTAKEKIKNLLRFSRNQK
ncbi:MAG: hypothetical protein BV456_07970 [Thermoplasmata archaeon M8B2D]|nr:MAG: hypothetical protein BV456_07970 [Thermoplasmata archaeon M8B2D]